MKSPTPTLPSSETIYYPTDLGEVKERKDRFAKIVKFIQSRNGFVTSIPGAEQIEFVCLPGSTLPAELYDAAGYDPEPAGETEWILAHAIVERFVRRADGELEPITAESTLPVAERRTHAGITKVKKFTFLLRP